MQKFEEHRLQKFRLKKMDKGSYRAFRAKHKSKVETESEDEVETERQKHRKPKLSEAERTLHGLDEEYRQKATELLASIDLRKLRKLADDLENALRKESIPFEVLQSAIDSKPLFEAPRKLLEDLLDAKMRDPRQEQEVE